VLKRGGIEKLKMEGKPQKRLKEVSADEKGRLIQAVAHCCGFSPTESNSVGFCRVGFCSISDELSIEEPQDSTFTSYLAAKVEMEDAMASIGRRKKRLPLKDSCSSHARTLGDFFQH